MKLSEQVTKGGGNNVDGSPVSRRRSIRSSFRLVSLFGVRRKRRAFYLGYDPSVEMDLLCRHRVDLLPVPLQGRLQPRISGAFSNAVFHRQKKRTRREISSYRIRFSFRSYCQPLQTSIHADDDEYFSSSSIVSSIALFALPQAGKTV